MLSINTTISFLHTITRLISLLSGLGGLGSLVVIDVVFGHDIFDLDLEVTVLDELVGGLLRAHVELGDSSGRRRLLPLCMVSYNHLVLLLLQQSFVVDIHVAVSRVYYDATLSTFRGQTLQRIRPVERRPRHPTASLQISFCFSGVLLILKCIDSLHYVIFVVLLLLSPFSLIQW